MLAYFPTIYNDELIYSMLSRYHHRSGNGTLKESTMDLFGESNAYIIPDLTTKLGPLLCRVGQFHKVNIDDWINNHTLYNYFTNFNTKNIKQIVRFYMINGDGENKLHYLTGQMATTIKEPLFFRYCPECLKIDIQKKGETYWRTYHQLPSVFICLEHEVPLEDSKVKIRPDNSILSHPSIENCQTKYEHDFTKLKSLWFYIIGEESYKVTIKNYDFDQIKLFEIYHYLLRKKGYMKSKGTTNQIKLREDFIDFFGIDFLEMMQSLPCGVDGKCWLKAITRKHRKSFHPVRHLLLIHFLGESVDTIYQNANKLYHPFGEGPYLCLNPAANHYLMPVLLNLKVTWCKDTKRPVGTFSCTCGFVYSRRGPDEMPGDKTKIGRIKEFGEIWLEKLQQLVEKEKLSYRACSKILKVDINTIIKYSKPRKSKPIGGEIITICNSKQQWLDLIKHYPSLSKTELRKKNPAIYMRIYRNDKEWLKNNSPVANANVITTNRGDWINRDLQVLDEVKKALKDLYSKEKPVRITVSSIGKAINQKSLLEKKADRLPLTMEFIDTIKETVEDFQKRRIQWSVNQLADEKLEVWKIMRKAGLKSEFYPSLADEILHYLK